MDYVCFKDIVFSSMQVSIGTLKIVPKHLRHVYFLICIKLKLLSQCYTHINTKPL